jgi:ribosomal protein L11 methyltransferase
VAFFYLLTLNTVIIKPNTEYIELRCFISGHSTEIKDYLIAALLNLGYDGFLEDNEILTAYIDKDFFSEKAVGELDIIRSCNIIYEHIPVENKNWNEEWERNFSPVVIGNVCLVRAPFHPPQEGFPCELIIEPKMAFGTGHHPTTAMIAEYILELDLHDKSLFDIGCGSGILGLLAFKRGAAKVEMADNDPQAVKNTIENIRRNNAHSIIIHLGGSETLSGKAPDLITANINRPVLLENMAIFYRELKPGGTLVLSGIIKEDEQIILDKASANRFILKSISYRHEWVMCVFIKPEN